MFYFKSIILTTLAVLTAGEHLNQRASEESKDNLDSQQIQSSIESKGYAPAGFMPEIPFELPTETKKPDTVYGPPSTTDPQLSQPDLNNDGQTISGVTQKPTSVYGPPKSPNRPNVGNIGNSGSGQQQPDNFYEPPLASGESQQPSNVYGPPIRTAENEVEDNFEVLTVDTVEPENFDTENEEVSISEDNSLMAVPSTFDIANNVDERSAQLAYRHVPEHHNRVIAIPERLVQARVMNPIRYVYTNRFQ